MKACNVLYQLNLYFWEGVIIPDWQLSKFNENTHKLHKIAYIQNCLGVAEKGGRENGGIARWLLGGLTPMACIACYATVLVKMSL